MRSRCGPAGRGPCPTALAVRSTPPLIAPVTRATDAHWLAIVPGRHVARDQGPDDALAMRVRHQTKADCFDVSDGSLEPRLLRTVACSVLVTT